MGEREKILQVWYPQLQDNSSGDQTASVVVKAVNQVVELSKKHQTECLLQELPVNENTRCRTHSITVTGRPDDENQALFCTKDVDKFFTSERTEPLWVLGSLSREEAKSRSWQDLGLNLFDLPWDEDEKVFHYVPLLRFQEFVEALKNEACSNSVANNSDTPPVNQTEDAAENGDEDSDV